MSGWTGLRRTIVPILVVWFGIGVGPGILTAFLISFFPIMVNIATGLATLEPELEDVLRVLGAKRWDVLVKVGLPRAMPYFYGSLKIAITLAFVGTVLAEMTAGDSGIGRGLGGSCHGQPFWHVSRHSVGSSTSPVKKTLATPFDRVRVKEPLTSEEAPPMNHVSGPRLPPCRGLTSRLIRPISSPEYCRLSRRRRCSAPQTLSFAEKAATSAVIVAYSVAEESFSARAAKT